MARITDSSLTKTETEFVKALYAAKGELTIEQLADKMERKPNSLTTMLSQVRKKFKLGGKKDFALKGVNLEPKKMTGQGRTSERTQLDDLDDLLGDESDESEQSEAA